jgi:polysaccharide deacetylase 2 family uncharacterized protein YibQ
VKNKKWLWILGVILLLGLASGYWISGFLARRWPVGRVEPSLQAPGAVRPKGPRLALVLDDWGQNTRLLPELKAFPAKLTIAVIPGLPYSRDCAQAAHDGGHEVIMHLPVEPLAKLRLAEGTLMVGMTWPQVKAICDRHALSVPYMAGLNNHEGSKGSADPVLMGAVAKWLQSRGAGMYFLDSVTTPKSVIPEQARLAGLPFARRKVFLDNVDEKGAIEKKARQALQQALRDGFSIAIGHPRPNTLKVLARMVGEFKAKGVEVVYVSSLAGPDGPR